MSAKASIPPSLKPLIMYIRRAEEVERGPETKHKMMAYFCRAYAMEVGLKLQRELQSSGDLPAEVNVFLLELMEKLEVDKKELPTYTTDDAKILVENFAMDIFKTADDKDRAGLADKNTARAYYSAGIFFEILRQFSDDRELEEGIKKTCLYAKWKATDIINAIKEGRKPTPGPSGVFAEESEGEEEAEAPEDAPSYLPDSHAQEDSPSYLPDAHVSKQDDSPSPSDDEGQEVAMGTIASAPPAPTRVPSPEPTPYLPQAEYQEVNVSGLSAKERRTDAIEYARFAIRAIEEDEVSLAMQRLRDALAVLKG